MQAGFKKLNGPHLATGPSITSVFVFVCVWAGTRSCCLQASFSRSALWSKDWGTVTAARITWRHLACAVWSNTISQSQVHAHFAHPHVRLSRHANVFKLKDELCLFSQALSCSLGVMWPACIAVVHHGRCRRRPGGARPLTLWSSPCPSLKFCSWRVTLHNVRIPRKKCAHAQYTKNTDRLSFSHLLQTYYTNFPGHPAASYKYHFIGGLLFKWQNNQLHL